ncbi:hypothetical protein HID58_072919 [Brassica napus]|uniref:BnaC06g31380D protein n=2 Tax=Brassica napus TaxID=3708 RepID=A0A078FEC5_BRANA|nr:hypothetical protein HID58_072919 [Brassica napus]CAF2063758.1 unnamed protein product [Brassica napus]CDY11601.1 BnaC06g31380D [Brassica napus]
MGNLLGCGTSLEVDGTAVVETKESSVKEKIKLQKDIVQALDAEIRKHVTLENNAMDAIRKQRLPLAKTTLESRRKAAAETASFLERQLVDLENATYTSCIIEGAMEVEEARQHLLRGRISSSSERSRC